MDNNFLSCLPIMLVLGDRVEEDDATELMRLECLKLLLDAGADVNSKDCFGLTLLHMAVMSN